MATDAQKRGSRKVERILHIRTLMAGGRWVPGITNVQVAGKFGVSIKTVEQDAAEASRQIRQAFGSDEDLKGELSATLLQIRTKAMDARQFNAAVEAIRLLCGIRGLEAPKEVNLNGGVSLKDLAQLRASTKANKS